MLPVRSADDTKSIFGLTAHLVWFLVAERVLAEFILCVVCALGANRNSSVAEIRVGKSLGDYNQNCSTDL